MRGLAFPELLTETRPRRGYHKATVAMIGRLLVFFSLTMLPPLFVGWWYGDGETKPFLDTFALTLSLVLICWLPLRGYALDLRNRQGVMAVVGMWTAVSLLCALSLGVAATGLDLVTAFGSVAGCLNNMGVGLGETSTTFGVLNNSAKWLLTLSMLVGRLEVFPLLLIFTKDFWH